MTGNQAGITYDKSIYNVEVTTTLDNATNKLVTDVKYFDAAGNDITKVEFNNKYTKPEGVTVNLEGTKSLEGRTLENEEFEFVLKGKNGNEIQRVKNDATGKFSFGNISILEAGVSNYTISEVTGNQAGITYDKSIYNVEVTTTLDNATNKLVTHVKYFDAAGNDITKVQFNNKYIAPKTTEIKIGVEKELKSRAQKAREFRFLLEGETDNTGKIRELATNNISGDALFKDIELKDVGKYIYKITEVKGKDSKIKYDKSEYKLIVDVTLNSTTNELEAKATLEKIVEGGLKKTTDVSDLQNIKVKFINYYGNAIIDADKNK